MAAKELYGLIVVHIVFNKLQFFKRNNARRCKFI